MSGGEQYIAYPEAPLRQRLFITVTRVARDQSWADVVVQNWAVQWRKRQPLTDGTMPFAVKREWGMADLEQQEQAWDRSLKEEAPVAGTTEASIASPTE